MNWLNLCDVAAKAGLTRRESLERVSHLEAGRGWKWIAGFKMTDRS